MNYKELFLELKNHNLRYISTGWLRIHPFSSTYEIPSQLTKIKHENEANVILEFGDQLDKLLCITCKCLDFKNSTIYRFRAIEISSKSELDDPKTTFATGELTIQTVEIFEPSSGLYSIKDGEKLDEIDEELYFGNALLFSFSN